VLIVGAAVAVALTTLGGSSNSKSAAGTTAKTTASAPERRSTTHRQATSKKPSTSAPRATSPAEASVAVLNGTETTGLAHRISGVLQQRGYSQATALSGRPSGANQVTVVEYASGHQADAEGVAHSVGATKVQPMEGGVASLAGSAKVVVIVGADKAAASP
jgi:LytR cell envelope-related transcriptional attenuator